MGGRHLHGHPRAGHPARGCSALIAPMASSVLFGSSAGMCGGTVRRNYDPSRARWSMRMAQNDGADGLTTSPTPAREAPADVHYETVYETVTVTESEEEVEVATATSHTKASSNSRLSMVSFPAVFQSARPATASSAPKDIATATSASPVAGWVTAGALLLAIRLGRGAAEDERTDVHMLQARQQESRVQNAELRAKRREFLEAERQRKEQEGFERMQQRRAEAEREAEERRAKEIQYKKQQARETRRVWEENEAARKVSALAAAMSSGDGGCSVASLMAEGTSCARPAPHETRLKPLPASALGSDAAGSASGHRADTDAGTEAEAEAEGELGSMAAAADASSAQGLSGEASWGSARGGLATGGVVWGVDGVDEATAAQVADAVVDALLDDVVEGGVGGGGVDNGVPPRSTTRGGDGGGASTGGDGAAAATEQPQVHTPAPPVSPPPVPGGTRARPHSAARFVRTASNAAAVSATTADGQDAALTDTAGDDGTAPNAAAVSATTADGPDAALTDTAGDDGQAVAAGGDVDAQEDAAPPAEAFDAMGRPLSNPVVGPMESPGTSTPENADDEHVGVSHASSEQITPTTTSLAAEAVSTDDHVSGVPAEQGATGWDDPATLDSAGASGVAAVEVSDGLASSSQPGTEQYGGDDSEDCLPPPPASHDATQDGRSAGEGEGEGGDAPGLVHEISLGAHLGDTPTDEDALDEAPLGVADGQEQVEELSFGVPRADTDADARAAFGSAAMCEPGLEGEPSFA